MANLYYKGKLLSGIAKIPRLTLNDYNALTVKPEVWIRTDAPESYKKITASDVSFSDTGITATDVDGAIKEINLLHGGTIDDVLYVNIPSPNTSNRDAVISLGNEIPVGTVGNSTGVIQLWGRGDKSTTLYSSNNSDHVSVALPQRSGVLDVGGPLAQYGGNDATSVTFTMSPYIIYFVSLGAVGGNGSQFLNCSCYLCYVSNKYEGGTVTYSNIVAGAGPQISSASINLDTSQCTLNFSTAARYTVKALWI